MNQKKLVRQPELLSEESWQIINAGAVRGERHRKFIKLKLSNVGTARDVVDGPDIYMDATFAEAIKTGYWFDVQYMTGTCTAWFYN